MYSLNASGSTDCTGCQRAKTRKPDTPDTPCSQLNIRAYQSADRLDSRHAGRRQYSTICRSRPDQRGLAGTGLTPSDTLGGGVNLYAVAVSEYPHIAHESESRSAEGQLVIIGCPRCPDLLSPPAGTRCGNDLAARQPGSTSADSVSDTDRHTAMVYPRRVRFGALHPQRVLRGCGRSKGLR
jgi:hypothetical protein